ncbi:MAG TPA: glycosyltransferase family 4 protein [Burkholderiales bacterium]|nr:glycosyltransferase family 4 protein [Burkholderiales bacterium]
MKVVFVNRFFHPDLAPTGLHAADVAFDLAAAGREVHAVTSRLAYDGGGSGYAAEETMRGVQVHRVWTTHFGRGSLAGRVSDYFSFYVFAFFALARLLNQNDIVVAKTDPPLISVFAALAARLRGARLVNWLQDVFPEAAARSGMRLLSGPPGAVARGLRDWSVRRAAVNVVLGERMATEVGRLVPGARLRVVPNWADGTAVRPMAPEASALRRERGFEGKFVVGYSGNLGRVHDCGTLLAAARLLAGERDVLFSFVGGGFHFARLRAAGLANVQVHGYVPEKQLGESLAACDVHLVTLLPAFEGLIVPSKFYGAAAAGRAVIFIGDADGEIARAIAAHGCGVTVPEGDAAGLAAAIVDLRASPEKLRAMGARARAAFEREWDAPIALARWREVIAEVSGRK